MLRGIIYTSLLILLSFFLGGFVINITSSSNGGIVFLLSIFVVNLILEKNDWVIQTFVDMFNQSENK